MIERNGTTIRRTDDLEFEPIGIPVELPVPRVEHRERLEHLGYSGHDETLSVENEAVTTDFVTAFPFEHMGGVSQDETIAVSYDRPHLMIVLGGRPVALQNDIARKIELSSAQAKTTTHVESNGSLTESGRGVSAGDELSQSVDGRAHYHEESPGFFLYDLSIDPPLRGAEGATIHVVRTTRGRTVGVVPTNVDSFSPHDWYPDGTLGPDRDVVRAVGVVPLPELCARPLGAVAGYETVESHRETRATGSVTRESTITYSSRDTILCTIDNKILTAYEPTTGAVVSTQFDTEVLHASKLGSATVALQLVAVHDGAPFVYGVDPHATGAPILIVGTQSVGVVALRLHPALVSLPDVKLSVDPPLLAGAEQIQGAKIEVRTGDRPGRAILTAELGSARASIPILIYPTLSVGCTPNAPRAIAFSSDGGFHTVSDASDADIYVTAGSEQIGCALGASTLHFATGNEAPFAHLQPADWHPSFFTLDESSDFARYITQPFRQTDDAQNILLVKARSGAIIKILCAPRSALSVVGPYGVSSDVKFPY